MSIHKLTAGSGYDYLTRQVAALDATEKGHLGLASYYTERGEIPGVWMGSGLAGIDERRGGSTNAHSKQGRRRRSPGPAAGVGPGWERPSCGGRRVRTRSATARRRPWSS
jgi:TrwC relaxase